jgi:Low molecular weight phosphotyrosine protein phosphatase
VTTPRVLFLCTHNSARSQMAEGFLRAMARDRFEVQSAGTEKTAVHPAGDPGDGGARHRHQPFTGRSRIPRAPAATRKRAWRHSGVCGIR